MCNKYNKTFLKWSLLKEENNRILLSDIYVVRKRNLNHNLLFKIQNQQPKKKILKDLMILMADKHNFNIMINIIRIQ
jgi:hypothetical protein